MREEHKLVPPGRYVEDIFGEYRLFVGGRMRNFRPDNGGNYEVTVRPVHVDAEINHVRMDAPTRAELEIDYSDQRNLG
jgi:hypothetical protein